MTYYPLEKILKIFLETYLESQGRRLIDYNFVGIMYEGSTPDRVSIDFANCEEIPPETEVIVDYEIILWDYYHNKNNPAAKIVRANAYSTALVPAYI